MLYPSKNQIVTFAGQNPCQYQLVLNGNPVSWVNRVKYLESVSAAAGAVDDHIDICPHNNIDIDFILL